MSIDFDTEGTFFQNWYASLSLIVALVITAIGFVLSKLVEASNYGVPQRRIRVFIVAHRKDLNMTYRFPETIVTEGLNLGSVLKIPKKTLNQDQVIRLNPQAHILGDMVPEGGSWKSIPYDSLPDRLKRIRDDMRKYRWPNFYRRFSREEIAGTITAFKFPKKR